MRQPPICQIVCDDQMTFSSGTGGPTTRKGQLNHTAFTGPQRQMARVGGAEDPRTLFSGGIGEPARPIRRALLIARLIGVFWHQRRHRAQKRVLGHDVDMRID